MKIYLLGVFHKFQTEEFPAFTDCIRSSCAVHGIKSIGEEMNTDALLGRKMSTVKQVAEELHLPHAYCDPDENERRARGILGEQNLKITRQFSDIPWTEQETAERWAVDCRKREKFWLGKVRGAYVEPMLFVCGIEPLDTFGSLLVENGFTCEILEKKWRPADTGANPRRWHSTR